MSLSSCWTGEPPTRWLLNFEGLIEYHVTPFPCFVIKSLPFRDHSVHKRLQDVYPNCHQVSGKRSVTEHPVPACPFCGRASRRGPVCRWRTSATRLALSSDTRSQVVGVQDSAGVTLLGQESLAVGGEVRVDGVAGDDGVEMPSAVRLGPKDLPSR